MKESIERIKVFGSFPKDYGTAQVMGMLEEHTRDAMEALIEPHPQPHPLGRGEMIEFY